MHVHWLNWKSKYLTNFKYWLASFAMLSGLTKLRQNDSHNAISFKQALQILQKNVNVQEI